MKFPKLLTKAKLKGTQVLWSEELLDNDDELIELIDWKSHHGIKILRPSNLAKLHARGFYSSEIFQLFRKNNQIKYLERKSGEK
jgi:hypothetical protein